LRSREYVVTAYSQYRFLVTANNGSPDFQVAEIMLFGN